MMPIHGTPGDKKTRDADTSRVFYLFIYLFTYLFIVLSQIGLYCLCR